MDNPTLSVILTSVKKSSQSHNLGKSYPALIVPLLLYICKRFSKFLSKHFIILPHILCPLIYASLYIVQHKDGNRKPQVFTPAVFLYYDLLLRYISGSTGFPLVSRILKSRCGPVDIPVEPTLAICCPCPTVSPTFTFHADRWL